MTLNRVGRMIVGWLDSEGYQPTVQEETQGIEWAIDAKMPNGWTHTILLSDGQQEAVEIRSRITFTDQEVAFLTELPAQQAMELLWEMRMGLLFRSTAFQILPPKDGFPEGFDFARQISYDGGLTRNTFMEALREVHKCLLFVNWSVTRKRELAGIPSSPTLKARFGTEEDFTSMPTREG